MTLLYQWDLLKEEALDPSTKELFADGEFDPDDRAWIYRMAEGVTEKRDELDVRLDEVMTNWTVDRLGYMERAILRLAAYEILHDPATPGKVVIDEAVELTKRFCDGGSVGFVNGALDRILRERPVADDPTAPFIPEGE